MPRSARTEIIMKLQGNRQIIYDADYDVYFCPKCGEFLEPKCSDLTCSFCANRPDRLTVGPIQVTDTSPSSGQFNLVCEA